MDGLQNYQGEFLPDMNWNVFDRETLINAVELYRKMFLAIDGFWFLGMKERFGDEVAMDRDLWAWRKYIPYEYKHLRRLFNIKGNDVEALFKLMQFSAWAGNLEIEWDLKSSTYGVIRVVKCPTLEALIREGEGRERYFCHKVEREMFNMQTKQLNSEMSARPLQLPPDTLDSPLCCEWEIRCDDQRSGVSE